MSVLVATAYMEEAERFDWLVAMDAGKVLATGHAEELKAQTATDELEAALLSFYRKKNVKPSKVIIPPRDKKVMTILSPLRPKS